MDAGDDYMLLSTQVTEAAPAEVTTEIEDDPTITKETLAAQLQEMEKVMENLGLEPKPETGMAASGAKPPSGFVQADGTSHDSDPTDLREGDVDAPHGFEHRDLHH